MDFSRRDILKMGALVIVWLGLGGLGRYLVKKLRPNDAPDAQPEEPGLGEDEQEQQPPSKGEPSPRQEQYEEEEEVPTWLRPLGTTGAMVSLFGLGGGGIVAHAHRKDEALQLIRRALDLGVNFIDTAPTYGSSEQHIGEALHTRRSEVILATKTLDRSYDETMRLFERSLEDLRTSYIDLYQIHGLRDEEDAREVIRPGGAVRALRELKEEGVVRFIGITGHRHPTALRYVLQHEDFDCVLIPLNPAEVHFQSFKGQFLDDVSARGMGIVAMKVAAYGRLLGDTGGFSMQQLLQYVCSLPISTAILGLSSVGELEENVRLCRDFTPYSMEEIANLEQLAKDIQGTANFFKTEW